MSEPFVRTRPGPGGYGAPVQRPGSGPVTREDPLAELARLVGKDDPFREAATKASRSSNVAQFPQLSAPTASAAYRDGPDTERHEEAFDYGQETAHPDFDAQLRGSLDERQSPEGYPRDSLRFPAIAAPADQLDPAVGRDFAPPSGHGDAPPLNADLWAEGAMAHGPSDMGTYDGPLDVEAQNTRSPKRTVIVLVAVLALTCGGLGATFLMREGTGHISSGSGTAPTIMADEAPVKVASPDMSKDAGADGNTALLEKTGSDKVDNAKVVTNQEQPIDLAQLPKGAPAQTDNGTAPVSGSASPFPAPHKVKTVLIRPDGSVVGEAPAAQGVLPEVPGGVVMPTGADGSGAAQDATTSPPVAKPSTPKSTARASSTPKSADATGSVSGAKQTAAPTRTPKAKPAAVAEADTPTDTTAAATPGTYAVQLAAPGTEQDAKDTATRLQKKYSTELGGLKPTIRKGESGSKSVYRVRVSNLSQDDAKSLCSKLQTSGGSCFVVRN